MSHPFVSRPLIALLFGVCVMASACGDAIVLIPGTLPVEDETLDLPTDEALDRSSVDESDDPVDQTPDDVPDLTMAADVSPDIPLVPPSDSVEEVVFEGCSTSLVRGLSQQLIDEMNCIQPGVMKSIAHIPEFDFYSVVFPYLQGAAATSVEEVMSGAGLTRVSSALRTVPQQYLLYRWYQTGRCNIGLAAKPGNSNHNGGKAIDTPDYEAVKSRFTNNGWRWLGSSDPVHYELQAGEDVRSVSVLALQRLWNRNNPNDLITEDGDYGPQSESRLKQAPSMGFPQGAMCAPQTNLLSSPYMTMIPDEDEAGRSMRVVAPHEVSWIEYTFEGKSLTTMARQEGLHFERLALPKSPGTLRAHAFGEEGQSLGALSATWMMWKDAQGVWFDEGAGLKTLRLTHAPVWLSSLTIRDGAQTLSPRNPVIKSKTHLITISTRRVNGPLMVDFVDHQGHVRQSHPLP